MHTGSLLRIRGRAKDDFTPLHGSLLLGQVLQRKGVDLHVYATALELTAPALTLLTLELY
jgi:hypothetical protein